MWMVLYKIVNSTEQVVAGYWLLFSMFPQGVLLGLSNTAGVLAGVFGTAATGYILQHG